MRNIIILRKYIRYLFIFLYNFNENKKESRIIKLLK